MGRDVALKSWVRNGEQKPLRVLQQHGLAGWQGRAKRDLDLGGFC